MTIGILSDLHLGDAASLLLDDGELSGTFENLREVIADHTGGEPLECLVLAGDTLDFSVGSFQEAFAAARPFFHALRGDTRQEFGLAKRLVFIPGNHDKHVWDALEWQKHVMIPLAYHQDPTGFGHSQSGMLDLRTAEVLLKGVSKYPLPVAPNETKVRYGGLFLEGLFPQDYPIETAVVYPNLYVREGDSTWVISHGHMLEMAWVILGELLKPSLAIDRYTLSDLEKINVPLSSMICTSVGQGGEASALFRRIQQEAKVGESSTLNEVLKAAEVRVGEFIQSGFFDWIDGGVFFGLRRLVCSFAENRSCARGNDTFFVGRGMRERLQTFYDASAEQAQVEYGLAPPDTLILGHTHRPVHVCDPRAQDARAYIPCDLFNTGGWLLGDGEPAVFFADEDGRLTSVAFRTIGRGEAVPESSATREPGGGST